MTLESRSERNRRTARRAGVRLRESKLTLALTALRLADCHGLLLKARRKKERDPAA